MGCYEYYFGFKIVICLVIYILLVNVSIYVSKNLILVLKSPFIYNL